ncbi:glycoside hydrolase [Erwinia endophytica]|uniref:glycoside hydrolase family 19 protein n=1 Tax=Erwinia endophytica TaxID=1563158 RepID=UPI001265E688|nr:glycoside hydrolase family 19 protein [Erwinia endophytica]KAB8312257.1 glycoside hydrolase [Erwinia endophytica]
MITITPELLLKVAAPLYISNINKRNIQQTDCYALPFHMNHWFSVYDINRNKLRVAHFLAQACCETAGFLALREDTDGKKYEPTTNAGRRVGNHLPGDGPKFIGRGLLHLTGRENYEKYGKILGEDLVNHPETVATNFSIAVRTACAFWVSRGLNTKADRDDFDGICHLINGGPTGRERRRDALKKAKKALQIS